MSQTYDRKEGTKHMFTICTKNEKKIPPNICSKYHAFKKNKMFLNLYLKGPRRIFRLYHLGKLNTGFCRARKVTSNGI